MGSSIKIANDPDKKQKLNAFNILVLIFVGLGSVSYGYTASVIGITIGVFLVLSEIWWLANITCCQVNHLSSNTSASQLDPMEPTSFRQ